MPKTDISKMEHDQDYTIEDAPERSEEQETLETPAYMDQIDFSDDDLIRLSKEVMIELEAIKKEYEDAGLIKKWKSLENQYKGKLAANPNQLFNLHKPTTKVKCRTIIRYLKKAFLKTEPLYSVTPRPEYYKEGGEDVCNRQQDYLDQKLDHGGIPFRSPLGKAFKNAVVKNGGVVKNPHEIRIEQRRRPETYQGNPIFTVQRENLETREPYEFQSNLSDLEKIGLTPESTEVVDIQNDGLDSFLQAYPDARKTYPTYVDKLEKGQKIDIVVTYEEIVYSDPLPQSVQPHNFYVRLATEGYEGLKTTKLIAERESFSWYEMKKLEEKGKFYGIDELMYQYDAGSEKSVGGKSKKKKEDKPDEYKLKPGYESMSFDIMACTYYFKIKEDDEEESKIVCWVDEDSEKVIGATMYPYYGVDCIYNPFFALDEEPGFWQPGVAEDMTDTNLAENAVLNFTLEGAFIQNTFTPITKNASIIEQFIEKTWTHGIPLEADPGDVDSLQSRMQKMDTSGLIGLTQMLTRTQDDVSGVSSGISGKESPVDPNAPAAKTLALMKASGINIEDYIENMLPAFNRQADIILQLTHQMSEEGRKYRARPDNVVDGNPFAEISRQDMVARTNIQSQAYAFNFDKLSEKQEDLALFSVIRQEPLIVRNPQAVYNLLSDIIKGWSPKWRNRHEELLPLIGDFKKEQQQTATMAVAQYMQAEAQAAEAEGRQPNFDPQQVMIAMNEAMARSATAPSPEVQKKEAKEAEKAQEGK